MMDQGACSAGAGASAPYAPRALSLLARVVRARTRRPAGVTRFLLPAMAGHAALAPRLASFFARPLVGSAFLVGGLAALAGNLSLLCLIHRSESAVLFRHLCPRPGSTIPASARH